MTRVSVVRTGKILLVLLAAVLLAVTGAWARPTTAEQAESVVANWLGREALPLGAPLGRQVKKVQTFSDEAGNPLYYVVYLNPGGMVFLPADDLVEPIIGFLPHGCYDPSPTNPLGALVNRDLPGRVLKARQVEARALEALTPLAPQSPWAAARRKWERLANPSSSEALELGLPSISDVRVAPFVQSRWSQDTVGGTACYNYFTPPNGPGNAANYVCGCVATAMAQLMRYWQHPTTGVGTKTFQIYVGPDFDHLVEQNESLLGGNGAGGPYNWTDMVLDPLNQGVNDAQRRAIGALTHDAGVSVNMAYTPGGSGTDTLKVADVLVSTFGYSNAKKGANIVNKEYLNLPDAERNAMVNPNLHAKYPVLFGIAYYTGTENTNGHAIVCDGYGYNASTMYHHLNMGWAGQYDAWYNLPNIDVGFNSVTKCIYNVYVDGSGEIIAGRVTDADGVALSGAAVSATRTEGGTYTATTDANGLYALAKVPAASNYTISVTKTGYKFDSQSVATGTSTDETTTTGNLWGVDFVPGGGGGALSEALDNLNLSFTTSGSAKWFPETTCWYYGGSAAQSGAIGVNQSTALQTTVVGPGTLSFYWGVNSVVWFNSLSVYLDGAWMDSISGGVGWTQKTLVIPDGSHTIIWQYTKTWDNINPFVPDCAWVDKVGFSPPVPPQALDAVIQLLLND